MAAVARLAAPLVPPGTEILAGLELGGVPISTALSLLTGLPQVLVRKQAKTYGTAKLSEGPDVGGKHVLVVEDVITTGGQVVASTEELRALGALVTTVLCVIDRRASSAPGPPTGPPTGLPTGLPTGPARLEEAGLSVCSVFDLDDLLGDGRAGADDVPGRNR